MFTDLPPLLAGLAVVFGPGLAVLLALGVRARSVLAGLSAPLTVGLVLLASVVTAVSGVAFTPLTVAVVVVLVCGTAVGTRAVVLRRTAGHSVGAASVRAGDVGVETATDGAGRPVRGARGRGPRAVLTGHARHAARALGLLSGLGGVALALDTWQRGLGTWSTPPQEHDPITHSVITAYIHHSGNAAPWQTWPLDVVSGEPVVYYPSGLPRLASLVTPAVGDPMTALNVVTVVLLAVAWPVSVAALAAAAVRLAGLGTGWTWLGGGIAALVAAALYRPAIAFPHDGGVLPNAAALVLVPGTVAVLVLLGRRAWALAAASGVACAGLLSLHPSVAVSVVVTVVGAWVGLALSASGRARLRASLPPVLGVGVVAALAGAPVLAAGLGREGSPSAAPATVEPTPVGEALVTTLTLPHLGFLDSSGEMSQVTFGVLAVVGAVAVPLLFRRGLPLVTAWLAWVCVAVSFQVAPESGPGAVVAGYFYNVFERVQAHPNLFVPALVAMLFVGVAAALVAAVRARPGGRGTGRPDAVVGLVAVGLVAVGLAPLVFTTVLGQAETNGEVLATRYRDPEFVRYDAADAAAARWLAGHVRPGETILNNANDGSTLAYVRHGLPILGVVSSGSGRTPDVVDLLADFHDYPEDAHIRSLLREHDVRWVYVDTEAPLIGAVPSAWHGQSQYALAPGLTDLDGLPGLRPAFHADTVTVYELTLPGVP